MENRTVVERTVAGIAQADAAGIAFVTLRCDRESDIIQAVEAYIRHVSQDSQETRAAREDGLFASRGWSAYCLADGTPACLPADTLSSLLESCGDKKSGKGKNRYLVYLSDLFRFLEPAGPYLGDAVDIALLKWLGMEKMLGRNNILVVIGCTNGKVCRELMDYGYVIDIPYPEIDEIRHILTDACTQCGGQDNELTAFTAKRLAESMRGFREWDIRRVISLAYARYEHPLRKPDALQSIIYEEKRQRIDRIRGLRWIGSERMTEVGGLNELQAFLREKGRPFREPLLAKLQKAEPPKALLIVGLPGGGKSTIANLSASILGLGKAEASEAALPLPLLHLSLTDMLDKYVGQSEGNFETAIQALEGIAPCVVVIDELEKLFGDIDKRSSSEVGSNLFSQFLRWMEQPQKKPILVIATANRIDRLPPECKRKGRFDEIFSVNIPNRRECLEIVKVHLKKYADVLTETDGSIDATIDMIAESFMRLAARERRFVSGADIESICRLLFTNRFCNYLAGFDGNPDGLRQVQASGKPFQYPTDEVLKALETELTTTRSFFDSNMAEAAGYWLQMHKLGFRSASRKEDDLFGAAGYLFNADTGRFYKADASGELKDICTEPYDKNLETMARNAAKAEDYDGALRATLAKYIYSKAR